MQKYSPFTFFNTHGWSQLKCIQTTTAEAWVNAFSTSKAALIRFVFH